VNRLRGHSFELVAILRNNDDTSVQVWECDYCGSLVNDRLAHRKWHREVEGE
jgi:hypothetical protein